MFEHIIGNTHTVSQISQAIAEHTLPHALLINGPIASAKFTIAMEIARVLNCLQTKAGACRCSNCTSMRNLTHPAIVLLGDRYFRSEIKSAYRCYLEKKSYTTVRHLLQSIRKFTRRVDPHIFQTASGAAGSKLMHPIQSINEQLLIIEGAITDSALDEPRISALLSEMQPTINTAVASFPHHIAIDMIRALIRWGHMRMGTAQHTIQKVAIIERADFLSERAANALLKLTEEPPPHLTILLLSTNSAKLIPTLRSRVRELSTQQRSLTMEQEILAQQFDYHPRIPLALTDFLFSNDAIQQTLITIAQQVCAHLQEGKSLFDDMQALEQVASETAFDTNAARNFLQLFRSALMREWYGAPTPQKTQRICDLFRYLNTMQHSIERLNIDFKDMIIPLLLRTKKLYESIS